MPRDEDATRLAPIGMEAAPAAAGDDPLLRPAYRRWLVFVLLLVAIFNFADRAILAVLAQPIKEDLRLSDTDLGILQGLGFLPPPE